MKTTLTSVIFTGCLALACGSGDTGGGSTASTTAPDTASACAKLVQYCLTGYSWSPYVTDQQSCQKLFDCIYNYYSGTCRQTLANGVSCLAGVTSSSGCSACDGTISSLQQSCSEPTSCLQ